MSKSRADLTRPVFALLIMLGLLTLPNHSAHAAPLVPSMAYAESYDPLETLNRSINRFNNVLDRYLLKPIVHVYQAAVPEWGRERVGSFLRNLTEPVTVLNSALQGNSTNAFRSFWRFTLNSTFGIGGIFDIAQQAGLTETKEDFGQTIGVYGVGAGPYLVLPLLGPSSGRDAVGKVVDIFTNPFNYLLTQDELIAVYSVNVIHSRSETLVLTDKINKTALDPYATMRSLYLQSRLDEIHNGAVTPTYNQQ